EEFGRRCESAESGLLLPEAPGADARPGEVLGRITDVREFPVEHADESVRSDHQIAESKIAVKENHPRTRRNMTSQPANREFENGMRLGEPPQLARDLLQCRERRRLPRLWARQEVEAGWIQPMNVRELLAHLSRQALASFREGRLAQDATPNRLAFEP